MKSIFYFIFLFTLLGCTKNDFSIDEVIIDSRDWHIYKIVKVGTRIFMAENLAYLPVVTSSSSYSVDQKYYNVYNYTGTNADEAKALTNFKTYGVLYNWPAAMDACPPGWHLPSDNEWKQLEITLGLTQKQADTTGIRGSTQGSQLKSTTGWNGTLISTNSSGFSAFPSGYRQNLYFVGLGSWTYFWSSSNYESDSSDAWIRGLDYSKNGISRYRTLKSWGLAVRCVKDI